jgi:hypothetical protein
MNGELSPHRREELEAICGLKVRRLLGGVASDSIHEVIGGEDLARIALKHGLEFQELQTFAWAMIEDWAAFATAE